METKKSKVTEKKVAFTKEEIDPETGIPTQVASKDNYGNISFNVAFENGDKGLWKVQKNFDYFKEGQEAEYTIEKKTSSKGNEYFVIGIPKQDKSYSGGKQGWQPKRLADYKADVVSFGFGSAAKVFKELAVADKLPHVDGKPVTLGDLGKGVVKTMWKLLDEIEGLE